MPVDTKLVHDFHRELWKVRLAVFGETKPDLSPAERLRVSHELVENLILFQFLVARGHLAFTGTAGPVSFAGSLELMHQHLLGDLGRIVHAGPGRHPVGRNELMVTIRAIAAQVLHAMRLEEWFARNESHFNSLELGAWAQLVAFFSQFTWFLPGTPSTPARLPGAGCPTSRVVTPGVLGEAYELYINTASNPRFPALMERLGPGTRDEVLDQVTSKRGVKRFGAYYTPDDVSAFICEQAVYFWIKQNLPGAIPSGTPAVEHQLSRGVLRTVQLTDEARETLARLEILDPAVGSGHFLVSMAELLHEILEVPGGSADMANNDLALRIRIVRALHGVDVMGGAVRTCRVRLYLWILQAAGTDLGGTRLPDLERTIKRGNSLFGFRTLRDCLEYLPPAQQADFRHRFHESRHAESDAAARRERRLLAKEATETYLQAAGVDIPGLSRGEVFHWFLEFPRALDHEEPGRSGGFHVIVGNPPFGNLLARTAKRVLARFGSQVPKVNQIAANFVELEASLLARHPGPGVLGNVLPGAILVNQTASPVRDLFRTQFEVTYGAFFGTRPAKVFPGLEIRVALVLAWTRNPTTRPSTGEVLTTESLKFTQEQRAGAFRRLTFAPTRDLVLGRRIGAWEPGRRHYFPRVGRTKIRDILLKLARRTHSIRDARVKSSESGSFALWRHATVGYWIIALTRTDFLRNTNEWVEMRFETRDARDLVFLVLNSSLFYLFWSTYSDWFHLNKGLVDKFPLPAVTDLPGATKAEMRDLAEQLQACLPDAFLPDKGRNGEFNMRACRPLLDEVDRFLANLYQLTPDQREFIITYDSFIR